MMGDYFMPLERDGAHYVFSPDWIRSALEPIPANQIRERLLAAFKTTEGLLLFQGGLHRVTLHTPLTDDSDYCYVSTDVEGTPDLRSEEDREAAAASGMDQYRTHVVDRCRFTEWILPEQRAQLETDYLERDYVLQSKIGTGRSGLVDWRSIADRSRVLVVGAPGAGKTSLLRRIAVGLATATDETRVPIYLELRHWQEVGGIGRLARNELSVLGANGSEAAIEAADALCNFVYLLDGLDEIPVELQQEAWSDIRAFVEQRPTCRYVISTRPSTRPLLTTLDFEEITLGEMTPVQVKELCWRRLPDAIKPWSSFWNRLASEPDVIGLAKNPLILTLLVARFLRDALSPHFVGEVVMLALEALTDEWDSVRGVKRTTGSSLSPKVALTILKELASEMSSQGVVFLSDEYCLRLLENRATPVAPLTVLTRIESQSGLIRRRQHGWEFSHKAVHEYLAATSLGGDKFLRAATTHGASPELWRYRCSESDWASALLPQLTDGPYQHRSIFLATGALSQRLVLSRDVIHAFSLSATWLFERLVDAVDVERQAAPGRSAQPDEAAVIVSYLIRAKGELELFNLATFVAALRNTRDGDASDEISSRLKASASEKVSNLAPLLLDEGRLVFERSADSQTTGVLKLYLH